MLPSHLQGLEAALAVGVIVLTIKTAKRLSSRLEKSCFFFFRLSLSALRACTCRLVLRDPLFSARMTGILISLAFGIPPCVLWCARGRCCLLQLWHIYIFPNFPPGIFDIPEKKKRKYKSRREAPSVFQRIYAVFSLRLFLPLSFPR